MKISRRAALAGGLAVSSGGALIWATFGRGRLDAPDVHFTESDGKRLVTSNGIPDHATGDFPNRHDPVPLRVQSHRLEMPIRPKIQEQPHPLGMWLFGVGINGIPFDPSGPFWNADGSSGWQFEVMHPRIAVALGIDVNHAHTQGRGTYHYHGMPTGLLHSVRLAAPDVPMHLLGYAADGFPVYGPECPGDPADLHSPLRRLRSSYRLKTGMRQNGPPGRFDGTFVEDYEYVPGYGDLDECNGRTGPTPSDPSGSYYYVLTDEFPHIPRMYRGQPDPTFRHGPPPGVSPPLPSELRT